MEKKLKLEEFFECANLLSGVSFFNGKENITILGFCNEKSISEGMRRIANKTLKKINENLSREQFQAINALTASELYDGTLPEGYEGTPEDSAKLNDLKQAKTKELLASEPVILFEELPDWQMMNNRLEERKEVLTYNYSYLFERLFLNY